MVSFQSKPFAWLAASVIALAVLGQAAEAQAFCRSTTCRAKEGRPCPTDDEGCVTEGAKLFWPTSCVSYATNKLGTADYDPADTRRVIRKAFETWSDVECPDGGIAKMTFQEREPVSCKKSQYDKTGPNVNVVFFQDDDWRYRGIDATLAKTSVTYNEQTGEIYDADIEINTANNTVTITDDPLEVEYDLQAILTHEVGHFLGIAHSLDPFAVMYPAYAPGSMSQRELHPDDVDAICAVYAPDSASPCETEPRGGFGATCNDPAKAGLCSVQAGAGASYGALGVLFGSTWLAVRARRRRRASAPRRDAARFERGEVDDTLGGW